MKNHLTDAYLYIRAENKTGFVKCFDIAVFVHFESVRSIVNKNNIFTVVNVHAFFKDLTFASDRSLRAD